MKIERFSESDARTAAALFNRYAEAEFVHKKLSEADFIAQFVTSDERVTKINLAAKADNGVLLGFANGCVKKGADIGYITFVLVEKEYRRQGIARQLLAELEKALAETAAITKYQIIFFNPIALTWVVPGTPGHERAGHRCGERCIHLLQKQRLPGQRISEFLLSAAPELYD